MALQCPRCPLRFDLAPMLADHLATDHGAEPGMTDALQPASVRAGRGGAPDAPDPEDADQAAPSRAAGAGVAGGAVPGAGLAGGAVTDGVTGEDDADAAHVGAAEEGGGTRP